MCKICYICINKLKQYNMKQSNWYLVKGHTNYGHYAIIKEELTDLIVATFEAVSLHAAEDRASNLQVIVDEHNKVVKLLNK